MRKLVLVLPAAAILLAVGVLLAESRGLFASPVAGSPTSAASENPKADPAGTGWQEKGKTSISISSP